MLQMEPRGNLIRFCYLQRCTSFQAVFITSTGAWKLAGFGFCLNMDQASADGLGGGPAFHYPVMIQKSRVVFSKLDSMLPLHFFLSPTRPSVLFCVITCCTLRDVILPVLLRQWCLLLAFRGGKLNLVRLFLKPIFCEE